MTPTPQSAPNPPTPPAAQEGARRRLLLSGWGAALLALAPGLAQAQDKYPNRPMEMIVPWGPGGGADMIGRLVARWLEAEFGTTMSVVNTPGASGVIGLSKLTQVPSDGHHVGVMTSDTVMALALSPQSHRSLKLADMVPLAVLTRQPSGLFTRAESRFKSWADVAAEAAGDPGRISVGTTGPGSPDDMSVEVLARKGIKLTAVPYPRPGDRYAQVLGGHVDLLYEQAGDIKGHLDGKTLRPLLFFTRERLPAPFAEVPVAGEIGIEFFVPQLRSLVMRADTDARRVAQLSASLAKLAASTDYKNYLRDQLALPESFIGAGEAPAFIAADIEGMKRVQPAMPAAAKP